VIPATLSVARKDPRLRRFPRAIVVLQFLCEYLDHTEFRPLKIEVVALECACGRLAAVDALRALGEYGYIRRGPRPKGESRHFRLLPAPLLPRGVPVKARAA
jgi:hypothetical protein